jgi:FemAB-related protein (PEP-CTERM system-associated)
MPVADSLTAQHLTVLPFDSVAGSWDEFVARAEGSSFCHLAGWRQILDAALGAECLYWVAIDPSGQWQGVLPLARVKSRLFGHYLVSLPFLNYGGPLGSPAAQERLAQEAVSEARRSHADLLELRTRYEVGVGLPVCSRKVTTLLELPAMPEELWRAFSSKLRNQIRRPMKEGLEVRFGLDQLEAFYEVFARNMRDLGTPVLPRAWFEMIRALFPQIVVFGAVYRTGRGRLEPLAAGCGFLWAAEFEMTWASALRRERRLGANALLYWSFMQELIHRGIRRFNFGRSTPGGGTHRFKQQWGGRDAPLPWVQYASGRRAATPSPDDPALSWGPRIWRWLPLPVANLLGPRLIRFLP